MFRRILVPIDFTPKSVRAARVAAGLAGPPCSVTLLHVIEKIDDDTPSLDRFYRRLETSAKRKFEPLARIFERRGAPARVNIVYGGRLREILRFAGESRADLIVMASHRFRPAKPGRGWSTLSYEVGLLSPCSVLLVK